MRSGSEDLGEQGKSSHVDIGRFELVNIIGEDRISKPQRIKKLYHPAGDEEGGDREAGRRARLTQCASAAWY